ncbi:helix-turn-helix transcriptional regulator [Afifella sp. IM 167]|uniref:helix-turn-helix transcriptional regulator n=1 Tax=Afifella sp. IM 167 TaxID=2033586 RepID=UPI001CCB1A83|nr:helix-turn-helix transcriptional regulator [Afifella sp. IM 167]
MQEFLTTRELAELLRIKERKIYELVAENRIPVVRVTGKFIFPREAIAAWLRASTEYGPELTGVAAAPAVVVGSHDPLLDWALREAGTELPTYFDGSSDGLERFSAGKALACGMHLPAEPAGASDSVERCEEASGDLPSGNRHALARAMPVEPVVLLEWARREQGFVLPRNNRRKIASLADLAGRKIARRQEGAGSRRLFDVLAASQPGLAETLTFVDPPPRSEADVAQTVATGHADCGLAIRSVAAQYDLGFLPIATERYDIAVRPRDFFGAAMQKLFAFARTEAFLRRAEELGGYDVSGLGRVHFNGG